MVFTSCAAIQPTMSESPASSDAVGGFTGKARNEAMPMDAPAPAPGMASPEMPEMQPQMVKTADLALVVDSVKETIDAATAIAQQQQGDVLNLQNQIPQGEVSRHTAMLQMRVPQQRLQDTLDALSDLGTVQRQSITAEDVSNQLVDQEARLRNLRKSEEMLLEIMERSGEVAQVLQVAQEVSNVRNSIEQIDAQLSSLRNRVAYSVVTMNLEEAIASIPPQRSAQNQLQQTWQQSTRSLSKFSVDLLQLGIWLLVYSPYLLLVVGGSIYGYQRMRRRRSVVIETAED